MKYTSHKSVVGVLPRFPPQWTTLWTKETIGQEGWICSQRSRSLSRGFQSISTVTSCRACCILIVPSTVQEIFIDITSSTHLPRHLFINVPQMQQFLARFLNITPFQVTEAEYIHFSSSVWQPTSPLFCPFLAQLLPITLHLRRNLLETSPHNLHLRQRLWFHSQLRQTSLLYPRHQ